MLYAESGLFSNTISKKLGIKSGAVIRLINHPANYSSLFTDFPDDVSIEDSGSKKKHLIHLFIKSEVELIEMLLPLKHEIRQDGCIWVSWPKKSGSIKSDLTEDKIRDHALMIDLVDIKVCAIDLDWSALKLVIPVKDRKNQ